MQAAPSSDAVTMRVPSGLKTAESTSLSCFSGPRSAPVLSVPDTSYAVVGGGDNAATVGAIGGKVDIGVVAASLSARWEDAALRCRRPKYERLCLWTR